MVPSQSNHSNVDNNVNNLTKSASMTSSSLSSPSSYSSPEPSTATNPLFTKFPELPPEIRHQIWRAALPVPGINFFNMHCIPNDHHGANRSTSPIWLHLDLRRLSILDSDDDVARYDPSAWQARDSLRRVCRESRHECAIPESESAIVTLTRPSRGLFVRAADGQVRSLTPYSEPGNAEPLVYRKVRVRSDDVLCLSAENCSLNLPFEEAAMFDSEYPGVNVIGTNGGDFVSNDDNNINNTDDLGWTYDPQLMPSLPAAIPRSRVCISMARGDRAALQAAGSVLLTMFSYTREQSNSDSDSTNLTDVQLSLLMIDAYKQELGERHVEELTPHGEVLWDRFGDRYVSLPWHSRELPAYYRLVKVWPENNGIRERYLRSALLQSPKRPVVSSS
ncbi:hypothetical protein F4804DRAFT_214593 [Jackrogersella minutella]|nr:hypothetical protein F4804DRAFT_214593 [Jackrogersella minutella]